MRSSNRIGARSIGGMALGREVTICTIYNGALDAELVRPARVALMTFNDVILRVAFASRATIIDLRSICV